MTRPLRTTLLLIGAAALVLAGCGDDTATTEPAADDAPEPAGTVVVTHSLLGDIVGNVVGDQAVVEVVMPRGADPHEFQASASQVADIVEADLVVANGLDFELGLVDVLEAAEGDGATVVEVGEDLDPIPFEDDHGHEDEDEADDDHGDEDPHWFTDPLRAAEAVEVIAAAVVDHVEGVDAEAVNEQAEAYGAEIQAAHEEIEAMLAEVPDERRKLITNHEVFGYFADRYDFEVVGAVIPTGSTLAEPSPAELAALADEIEEEGVPAIFADASASDRLVQALAAETGEDVEVVDLFTESLGEDGSGGETYLALILTNAERISGALA